MVIQEGLFYAAVIREQSRGENDRVITANTTLNYWINFN